MNMSQVLSEYRKYRNKHRSKMKSNGLYKIGKTGKAVKAKKTDKEKFRVKIVQKKCVINGKVKNKA